MTTPKLSPAQNTYALARAAYETVLAALTTTARTRVIAAGLDPDSEADSDAALEIEEAVRAELDVDAFARLRVAAEDALIAWGLAYARTAHPAHVATMDELAAGAVRLTSVRSRLIDLSFRLAA